MIKLQNWFHKYNMWSFTKRGLWKQCRRAYYYRYIGTALSSSDDFDIDTVKQLKDLTNKNVLRGKLVHEVLEHQIEMHHLQQKMNEDVAKDEYIQKVETSRKELHTIVEYYNGEEVDERFFDRIRESGFDQLDMFFGVIWPQLVNSSYLRHEKFDRFKVENVPAIVKIDYISKDRDGKAIISDWKTGADNEEYENDLQIGAYVLWAVDYYNLRPEQILSQLVYLRTGIIRTYEFSGEKLEEIKTLIISDFEEMNRTYQIEYFTAHPAPKKCLSCQFASICPHSSVNIQTNQLKWI